MATETLRPSAPGDLSELATHGDTPNWECVDEVGADDDSTYVVPPASDGSYYLDFYNLPASSGAGEINFITVYFRRWGTGGGYGRAWIKSNGSTNYGGERTNTGGEWLLQSWQVDVDPADGLPWEWAAIDNLQIGIALIEYSGNDSFCTQIYVEIDYTPIVGIGAQYIRMNPFGINVFGIGG